MKLKILAVAAACLLPAAITPAAARPSYDNASGTLAWTDADDDDETYYRGRHGRRHRAARTGGSYGLGPRPRQWCGWWMRSQRGGGADLNLAWNWSRWGRPTAPQVGAVVVWRHHVGEIVGRASNGSWIVRSGNDGGTVRTRARSVAGAVFRI